MTSGVGDLGEFELCKGSNKGKKCNEFVAHNCSVGLGKQETRHIEMHIA